MQNFNFLFLSIFALMKFLYWTYKTKCIKYDMLDDFYKLEENFISKEKQKVFEHIKTRTAISKQ